MIPKIALFIGVILVFSVVAWVMSCGNDDDDSASNGDDGDAGQSQICKNGEVIDPLPNPDMKPDADCTQCHSQTGIAPFPHEGIYSDDAPTSCMQPSCHACPVDVVEDDDSADDDDSVDDDDDDTPLEEGPGGFDPEYRTSPDFFTMMTELKPGNFNAQVQIWYSTNIQPIIDLDSFDQVPEGTTSIQEADTDADDTVDALTIMVKMGPDYDPENNNWYYETRDPDGTLRSFPAPGKIQVCIDCHEGFPNTDFLAGIKLR